MAKVVHISTTPKTGGAARASYRLNKGLLNAGVDSHIFAQTGDASVEKVKVFKPSKGLINSVRRIALHRKEQNKFKQYQDRPVGLELFTHDRTPYREDLIDQLPEADIYHLHWVSRFLDLPSFFQWVQKPVVWTLHDMNTFTGGCHYDNFCGKYAIGCGACPQLGSTNENDLSREVFNRKKESLAGIPSERCRIVADSYWLADEAQKSDIFSGKKVDTIHYGLDHNFFKPLDKASVRSLLGIPDQKKVILFGAPSISNRRKGYLELMKAIEILRQKREDLFILSFGGGEDDIRTDPNYLHLGKIENDRFLAWVYNAADVFVIPSLQEAFGQTCLEAMACGVACTGFNTGGIPDMIKPGENGFLADNGESKALADAIDRTLLQKVELGLNARKMVESRFTLKHQADAYVNVYNELLES